MIEVIKLQVIKGFNIVKAIIIAIEIVIETIILKSPPRLSVNLSICLVLRFTNLLDVNVISEGIDNMKLNLFGGVNSFFYNIHDRPSHQNYQHQSSFIGQDG